MIREALNVEGPLFGFLDKVGQLVLLSILWILGCLPVITIGTATTALYYAVVKSIRRGRGNAIKEFLSSYKANLRRGITITVPTLIIGVLLVMNIRTLQESGGAVYVGSVLCLALLGMTWIYICPVLSRFSMKAGDAVKLAFVMALKLLHYTLILGIGAAAGVLLQIYILPVPTILLLPGIGCFAATYLIEKALRRYMPEKKENDNAWYYE